MKIYIGNDEKKKGYDLKLIPGKNLYTGAKSFVDAFNSITTLETDLLNLSSGIYAADLAVKRNELENYIRTIHLDVDVVNYHALERVKQNIIDALYVLSCDNWQIKFFETEGASETKFESKEVDGIVLLFSGGLDSLCGSTYYLDKKMPLHLVSHINNNRITYNSQQNLFNELKKEYTGSLLERTEFRVNGRKIHGYAFPEEREDSQRTRSFLFLTLASLVARRVGYRKIVSIAENGQFAIHLPLSAARVGPFSTHTADPKFVKLAEQLFVIILGLKDLKIENPFLYSTKSEIIKLLPQNLYHLIEKSVSCWKASRIVNKNHCGECIPCFTRRIALESNGIKYNEYDKDVFNLDIGSLSEDDEGKRNLSDFLSFVKLFNQVYTTNKRDLLFNFPELINDSFDYDSACDMYFRMTTQAKAVFDNYPFIKEVIK